MSNHPRIRIKRIYDPPADDDGLRVLVDRLWPRGIKKEAAALNEWRKDVTPSDALRRWIHEDPQRWEEFVRRYQAELDQHPDAWRDLIEKSRERPITLLYAARDETRNHAVVLRSYLADRAS